MITFAFLPKLGRAASFPHGVNQLDAIAVSDAQHRGRSQKARGPRGVGLEEPCQAGALGYLREQRYVIACQPAIEGPGPAAFDSMQQGQRDDFAGIQFGLRVFRDLQHLLVHRVEQCDNKILGSHTPGSSRLKSVQPQLELSRDYLSTRTLAITYQTNTIGYYPFGCHWFVMVMQTAHFWQLADCPQLRCRTCDGLCHPRVGTSLQVQV